MGSSKAIDSVLFKIGENPVKSSILLFAISLLFFIGLGNVHLFDWDEINFAESAREMIKSGDYLRVQINYNPFWEKPPFFFWLQVGAMKIFGVNEFAARFPNALFGFIYLITFYFIGKRHYNGRFGLFWALLFLSSLLPQIYFKSGIIDPVFNYFIFLSIYFMLRVIEEKDETKSLLLLALLSGVFSGLSVITKGPVGFLLLGLTLFVYLVLSRFKNFPSFKNILFFLIGFGFLISFWLGLEVMQNGWGVLEQFIRYQIELFNSPVAGHDQPFYYHFVVVFFGCFPISIIALPQFKRRKSIEPYNLRIWFIVLFWVVIILFSISTTKIIHYSSMTYAPLSFLAALTIHKYISGAILPNRFLNTVFLIVGLLIGLVIAGLPIVIYNKESLYPYINDPFAVESLKHAVSWSGYEFLIGCLLIVGVIASYLFLVKKLWEKMIFSLSISMSLTLLLVLFFILPKVESFTQGPNIEFLQSVQNEDCYIESYGYKSYAQYFYADQPFGLNDKRKDQNWLLNGDIDKTVYLISKITNDELDSHPNFIKLKTVGGFNFYKREP